MFARMQNMKRKRFLTAIAAGLFSFALSGCGKAAEPETIQISVWSSDAQLPQVRSAMEQFCELHKDEVTIEYTISAEGEDTCKETVLSNPQGAADIFAFADDQLDALKNAGCLLEITENGDAILASVGGADSGAATAVLRDGKLYAYPMSAGNGYFLYYNKAYFSDTDIVTLDRILDVAEANGKRFTMDFGSGWYIYSFFQGAGLTVTADDSGEHNLCDWNATDTAYRGVDVAEAMLKIAEHPGFVSLGDDGFTDGVKDGSVIAGVNGAWNAETVAEAWGENYGAAKLPSYTLCGDQVQMCSFMGYKLIGINAYTKYPEWSMRIAEYLTSKEQQLERFTTIGDCPANQDAAAAPEVQAAPAIAAITAQSRYGYRQNIADPFWEASKIFGVTISAGNPSGDDLQGLLDETVVAITQ